MIPDLSPETIEIKKYLKAWLYFEGAMPQAVRDTNGILPVESLEHAAKVAHEFGAMAFHLVYQRHGKLKDGTLLVAPPVYLEQGEFGHVVQNAPTPTIRRRSGNLAPLEPKSRVYDPDTGKFSHIAAYNPAPA